MEESKEIDRLFTICESTAEDLRQLNQSDPLLAYDFDTVTCEVEREALKKRFFDNFGPSPTIKESVSEEVFVIASLYNFLGQLNSAVDLQKMKGKTLG